jgi:hypothetical protein
VADPIDLIFEEPMPGNPRPLDLIFGALDTSTSAQACTLSVTLPLPSVVMSADYDVNNAQRMYAGAAAAWQVADQHHGGITTAWRRGARAEIVDELPWRTAIARRVDVSSPFARVEQLAEGKSLPWSEALPRRIERASPSADMLRTARPSAGGAWQEAVQHRAQAAALHGDMLRHVRPYQQYAWQLAARITRELLARVGAGGHRRIEQQYPWDQGRRPPAGITILPEPPQPPIGPPCYTPPAGDAVELYFATAWAPGTALYFSCRDFDLPADLAIPYRRVYVAAHSITVTTYPGGDPVTLFDPTISTDADSYCWTLSATGPVSLMDQLAESSGAPAQIRVTIDGLQWVFAVEKIGRTRAFGQLRAQITGRSVTCALDEPWAAAQTWTNATQVLAAQLVDQALDLTGVAAEWNVDDWLIPAGAWSHAGTPLSAVKRVAESIGAIVHSDPLRPVLQILKRYPLLPWEWYGSAVAPDVQLPLAAVLRESYERRDAPAYNRAIVSGATQGVLGLITRAGTAGDLAAPMVTDALATAQEAVLQRGQSILGAAGRQALIALDLPVLTGGTLPGVLSINQLTEVIEPTETWRGMVRAVQVKTKGAAVRQTVTFERHIE